MSIVKLRNKIIKGHVLDVLRKLPDECIDTVITSPPYWGLRSYLDDTHPNKPYEIGKKGAVSPFAVIPSEDFYKPAIGLCELAVKDAAMWVPDYVSAY